MGYFWKSKFISKELQEHINRTIKKVQSNKIPTLASEEVKEFIEKASTILSGSNKAENK
jgi:hypothetical protein